MTCGGSVVEVGGDQELALFRGVEIVFGVVGQGKGGAGSGTAALRHCGTADGTLAVELFHSGIDSLA